MQASSTTVPPTTMVVSPGSRIEPQAFQQAVQGWLSQGKNRLAIDLGQLAFVESSGLGALVFAYKAAQQQQGHVVLFALQPYVRKLVDITKLDRVLPIYETESEALAALESGPTS